MQVQARAKTANFDAGRYQEYDAAHLLGDPWAQEWGNVFSILGLSENSSGYDLTKLLKAKNLDAKGMVRYGEGFYKSLGFAPLPKTFKSSKRPNWFSPSFKPQTAVASAPVLKVAVEVTSLRSQTAVAAMSLLNVEPQESQ